jgi:hypothetical protein
LALGVVRGVLKNRAISATFSIGVESMSPTRLRIASGLIALAIVDPTRADCIEDAAVHHQVNAMVLRAIGWHESRLDPAAVGRNANGSVDIGAFQINSAHLPDLAQYGVTARLLADGCISAYVAAWHYRRQVDRLGNTWAAVGAYHSRTPARGAWYADRIAAILMSWGALPRAALPYPPSGTLAPGMPAAPSRPATAQAWTGSNRIDDAPSNQPAQGTALFDALAETPPAR